MSSPDRTLPHAFLDFIRPELDCFALSPTVAEVRRLMKLALAVWNGDASEIAKVRRDLDVTEVARFEQMLARRRLSTDARRIASVDVKRTGKSFSIAVEPAAEPSAAPSTTDATSTAAARERGLYEVAKDVLAAQPWELMLNEDLFGVANPETGEVDWLIVNGASGTLFGVVLYRGRAGFDLHQRLMSREADQDDMLFGQEAIVLSFVDRKELLPRELAAVRASGVTFRGANGWPSIESHGENRVPRAVDAAEARRMSAALEQLLVVHARVKADDVFIAKLAPDSRGRYLVRRLDPSSQPPTWIDAREPGPEPIVRSVPAFDAQRVENLLRETDVVDQVLEVELFATPAVIDDGDVPPYMPATFLAVDAESGVVVTMNIGHPKGRETFAQEKLFELVEQQDARPRLVAMRFATARLLGDLVEALGGEVELVDELPGLDRARAMLTQFGM